MLPIFAFAIQVASHAVSIATQSAATTTQIAAPPISFETLIEIMLTCLGVMLTALAIGIGVIAIWGYVGLKDELKRMATRLVRQAMLKKLKDYPDAADMLRIMRTLQTKADLLDELQKQTLSAADTKPVESASNVGRMEEVSTSPIKEPEHSTAIEPYPGEEERHASTDRREPPAGDS